MITNGLRLLRVVVVSLALVGTAVAGWPATAMASTARVHAQTPTTAQNTTLEPTASPSACEPDDESGEGCQSNQPCTSEDENEPDDCPPAVIPETPVAVLLPLSAGALLAGAYLFIRRRNGIDVAG